LRARSLLPSRKGRKVTAKKSAAPTRFEVKRKVFDGVKLAMTWGCWTAVAAVCLSALAPGCAHSVTVVQLDPGFQHLSSAMQFQQTDCPAPPCGDAFDGVRVPPGTRGGGYLGELGLRWGFLVSPVPNLWLGVLADWRAGVGSASALGPFESSVHAGAYRGQTSLGSFSLPSLIGLPLELRWDVGRFYSVYGDVEPAWAALFGPSLVAPDGEIAPFSSSFTGGGFVDLIFRVGIERKLDFGRYGVGICGEADTAGLFRGVLLTLSVRFDNDDIPYTQLR
jgi:hypothetical protein